MTARSVRNLLVGVKGIVRAGWMPVLLISLAVSVGCSSSSESREQTQSANVHSDQLARCQQLLDQGDWHAAEQCLKPILLSHPNDGATLVLAAGVMDAKGKKAEAIELLDREAERSDDPSLLMEAAAELMTSRGDLAAAAERWKLLIERYPKRSKYYRLAAHVDNRLGYRFDANENLRTLRTLVPLQPLELWSLMNPVASYRDAPSRLIAPQDDVIESELNRIRHLYSESRLREAIDDWNQLPESVQQHPAAEALKSRTLLSLQRYEPLREWLTVVGERCARYPDHLVAAGGLAMHDRRFESAVGSLAEAIRREPMDLEAVYLISVALDASGDSKAASTFRTRSEDIKGLVELAGDVYRTPSIAPRAFEILQRELNKIGMVYEAFSWGLIANQRSALDGVALKDDSIGRFELQETINQRALDRLKLGGLDPQRWSSESPSVESQGIARQGSNQIKSLATELIPPVFANVARDRQLNFQYYNATEPVEKYFLLHQALGAGVACLDYDLDGNVDLYLAQGACDPPESNGTKPNLLARNLRESFVDVTRSSGADDRGYSMSLTAGDWNQDGFADLIVGNLGRNQLLINQGDGTFRSASRPSEAWSKSHFTTALALADVTGDHLPEIVEVNYTDDERIFSPIQFYSDGSPVRLPGPTQFTAAIDRILVNVGDGSAAGKLLDSGIDRQAARYGLGVFISDVDDDGRNEILVANDQTPNQLWKLSTDTEVANLIDIASASGVAVGRAGIPHACMGIAGADFDADGRIDFHITNFDDEWSNLYMQIHPGFFADLAAPYQIDQASLGLLGFGTQAIDYDNNGTNDLVVGNGDIEDFRSSGDSFEMPTQILRFDGQAFHAESVHGDSEYWDTGHLSRCVATLDWNGDGRLDFVVTDLMEPVALLENQTATMHHWLQIQLVGTRSERDAIGAKVTIEAEGVLQSRWMSSGDGYMGKNQSLLQFGVGSTQQIDRLEVSWPTGHHQQWTNVDVDSRYLVVEGQTELFLIQQE